MSPKKFILNGWRELAAGKIEGPIAITETHTLSRAQEVGAATLWFEKEKWAEVSIQDRYGHELARYRRFPPGRPRPETPNFLTEGRASMVGTYRRRDI